MNRIRYLLMAAAVSVSAVATAQNSISQRQYWLDGNIAEAQDLAPDHATIAITALHPGLHALTVRVKDTEGLWSPQVSRYFIKPYDSSIGANAVVQHQYWIDGKMEAAVTAGTKPQPISVSSLHPGLHSFSVRVQDQRGLWSSQVAKYFIKPYENGDVSPNAIAQPQYWIDGKMKAAVTSDSKPQPIEVTSLEAGIHTFGVRVQDLAGRWSSQLTKVFLKPYDETSVDDKEITQHQYWIDGKMEAAVTQTTPISLIEIEGLKPGVHSLTVRAQDNTGAWSSIVSKYFIIASAETSADDKEITQHQYWIDGKMEAAVSQATPISLIEIEGLKPGVHSLTVRVQDNTGVWSSLASKYFTVNGDDVVEETTITRYMYWFDDDTDDFTVGRLDAATGTMNIDISDMEAGTYTLWWRCGDSKGAWSEPRSVTFESKSLYSYTVPESGIGTFAADVNLTLPDGLNAHFCTYLKEVDEGLAIKIIDIDGRVINQNTGVLLSGTPNETYQLRYTTETGSPTEGNKLVPVVESTHIEAVVGDYTNYMLKGGTFIKIKEEDESIMMPDHRAYLPLLTSEVSPGSGEAASVVLLLWDDGMVTGVESIGTVEKVDYDPSRDGNIYTISGQRLSSPRKGINIINGRKVIVK